MITRTGVTAFAALSAVLVASISGAASADAAPVTVACGDVLAADTTLTSDLTCVGSGLTLLGDVTLDLGGHALAGNGTGTALALGPGVMQTVRNGTVSGWATRVGEAPRQPR